MSERRKARHPFRKVVAARAVIVNGFSFRSQSRTGMNSGVFYICDLECGHTEERYARQDKAPTRLRCSFCAPDEDR